jgi:hypothetical protein
MPVLEGMLRSEEQQTRDEAAVPPQSFNPTVSRLEGRPVVRSPEQLRLHRALKELGWTGVIDELNDAARLKDQSVPAPVLITTNGTILAGFGRWRSAPLIGRRELHCVEYPLSDEDALQFILAYHRPRPGWNAFICIRMALTLEPYLQQRALENMRKGGKYKGLASLPEAQRIDVRQEIANIAGTGTRNVTKAKAILRSGHPRLIDSLANGTLRIHRAMQWCRLPKAQQLEELTQYTFERAKNKVIRKAVGFKESRISLDILAVLNALPQQEARKPGSVVVRRGRRQHTVILIGQDLLTALHPQTELEVP